jgi:hypothetical protein
MSLNDQPEQQDSESGQATVHVAESLEGHMKALIYGGVAVIVVIVGIIVVTSAGGGASEAGWSKFAEAASASDFANVASDFPGTEVAVWARLREAEIQLGEGVRLQFTDRAAANSQLKKAGEAFDSVIDKASDLPKAQERAMIGQARLLEATSDGDLSKAIEAYKGFSQRFQDSVWSEHVAARIKSLEAGEAGEFYAWFSQQNPKPEDRQTPQDGLPAGHPEIPVSLPAIPDELIPADWSEVDLGAAAGPATGEAAADGSATEAKPAADEPPAAEDAASKDAAEETEKPKQE